jgi:hypothetical protein
MAIQGHKERALLRRGYQVQEALNRRPKLDEYQFLRRNPILTETINELEEFCKKEGPQSPFCELKSKIDSIDVSEQTDLINGINIIYKFFRSKNNNKTIFRNVIDIINKLDGWGNAIRVMSSVMSDDGIKLTSGEGLEKTRQDVRDTIKKLIDSKETFDVETLEKFLTKIRQIGYNEYEKSFVGKNFEHVGGKWQLPNLDLDTKSFWQTIRRIYKGEIIKVKDKKSYRKIKGVEDLINHMYDTIIKNKAEIFETAKADLFLTRNLYFDGEVIVPKNTHIEVKKMDYAVDSYMSEFYAIYKDGKLESYLEQEGISKQEFLNIYNYIIDNLYLKLQGDEGSTIITEAENNIFGIIYDKELLIPRLNKDGQKNFEFYWSNKGQRSCEKDHRLSIRFRPTSEVIMGYLYNLETHSNKLKEVELAIDVKPTVFCKIQ